jgi:hypothetical protein
MATSRAKIGLSLVTGALLVSAGIKAEIIFEENFDDQPDWTSAMYSTDSVQRAATHTIPNNWFSVRQDPYWAPSTGHSDRHEAIEILASNAEQSRSETGKSYVSWRDSHDPGWKRWNSESMLMKNLGDGYDELYVEFWIRFSPDWYRNYVAGDIGPASKIFRIASWNGQDSEYQNFGGGNNGPLMFWDHKVNSYGTRNSVAFRSGPHGDNYQMLESDVPGMPRGLQGLGDVSLSFAGDSKNMGPDGALANIPDRLNGGLIPTGQYDIITHDQIFGPEDSWTKMAFYVKMNSAPGKQDGEFRQWLNDKQIFFNTNIPWIKPSETQNENAKWNNVSIGGNDYFQDYPNEDRHEEWYSIDDIVIRSDIPNYVGADGGGEILTPPNPPVGLSVR